jgi:hypothetical protein
VTRFSRQKLWIILLAGYSVLATLSLAVGIHHHEKNRRLASEQADWAEARFPVSLSRLVVEEHASLHGNRIFAKSSIFTGKERTFADLYAAADRHFALHRRTLEQEWGLSGDLLKAAFLMNVVHNLWANGAPDGEGPREPVSVNHNPDIPPGRGVKFDHNPYYSIQRIYPQDYLKSAVSDCNDNAMMLYLLLRIAGFEARQVGTVDHIYLAVHIAGAEYIMDAWFNFFTPMGLEEFLRQPPDRDVTFHLFPSAGTDPALGSYRKKEWGRRILYLVTEGRLSPGKPANYDHWNQFDEWYRRNYVVTEDHAAQAIQNGTYPD